MTAPTSPTPPPVGTTVHIYRGIMDRATTWRNRIDAPTNWAIISAGTAASFVLNDPVHSHAVLLLMMSMVFAFLTIEARRMRYYDLWSSWVRLLETEYFAPIISNNQVMIDALWEQMIVRDMDFPHFKSGLRHMLIRRLQDNYMAILLFLLMSWLLKLLLHERSDLPPRLADNFVNRATIGPIPGWLVLAIVLSGYAVLLVIVLVVNRQPGQSSEVLSSERILQRLASPLQQPVNPSPWHVRLGQLYAQARDEEIEHLDDT
jgi:uncharacterized membrane protein